MVITQDRPSPKTSGIKTEVGFTIDPRNLAHVVSLLRDAYSDPISAVLREYSVNAYDAHVAAGIADRPVEVTLPGRFDPVLKIRDFGPGLSAEQIESLFCSYGASSKRDSNDYTGCLGIGCKSAFAITDSFTVTTYHGGRARTYSCYLDESEVGKAALLSDVASKETGVLVSVPIKKDDMSSVESRAVQVFRYFKTPPKVLNAGRDMASEIRRPKYRFSGPGFHIQEDNDESHIVMGNIAYPLNLDHVKDGKYKEALQYNAIDLELPIGAVDIAPSREELKYNARTKKAIEDALLVVFKAIGKKASDDIAATSDLMEAMKIYAATFQAHHLGGILRGLGVKPMFKGTELKSTQIELYNKDEEATTHRFSVRHLNKLRYQRRGKSYTFENAKVMEVGQKDLLFHDTSSNQSEFYGRIRTLLNDSNFESAYIFKTRNGGMEYLKKSNPLVQELKFEPFESLTITPPDKVTSGSAAAGITENVKHNVQVFTLNTKIMDNWVRHQSDCWHTADIDLNDPAGGVYLNIDRFLISGETQVRNYADRIKLIQKWGHKGPIYGFKPSVTKQLEKNPKPQWVTFSQKIEELWEARVAPYRQALCNYRSYCVHLQGDYDNQAKGVEHAEFQPATGTVANLYKEALTKCSTAPSNVSLKKELEDYDTARGLLPTLTPTIDLDGHAKLFLARYPMAKFFNVEMIITGAWHDIKPAERKLNIKLLAEYVRLVDVSDPAQPTTKEAK
jgi:hypothetical protein